MGVQSQQKQEGAEGEREEGAEPTMTELQAGLFETPDEFKTAVAPCKNKMAEESTWLTGIAEYELPMEYKLKNLEATEAAKRNIIASKQANAMRLGKNGAKAQDPAPK